MAKDTSTLKCPEMESECKHFGSTVVVNRFKITNGFRLMFDVQTLGYDLSKKQIISLSSYFKSTIRQCLDSLARHVEEDSFQLELNF